MTKIIDTHCHPYLNKIKNKDDIINNFFSNGGEYMIVIGTNLETTKESLDIAKINPKIFATMGIHPCDIGELEVENTILELENIYRENSEKIVGLGECGLDYYWLYKNLENSNLSDDEKEKIVERTKEKQKLFFIKQIELAKKLDLPIIIHNRNSKEDILEILEKTEFKNFIFHCYSEDLDYAKKLIELSPDCKISFSGIVTFSNAKEIQQTAKNIPLKNILAETDSPYLTPTPFRGKEENEPIFTRYVIEKIASLRGENYDYVENEIYNNSVKTFKIEK
ncbi:MAG: TatD family hydrolase [Candidatus Gracilibacteria bacterium]|nr:TatD family hydrolase [Candidatus Gracilibacteria bacterium]